MKKYQKDNNLHLLFQETSLFLERMHLLKSQGKLEDQECASFWLFLEKNLEIIKFAESKFKERATDLFQTLHNNELNIYQTSGAINSIDQIINLSEKIERMNRFFNEGLIECDYVDVEDAYWSLSYLMYGADTSVFSLLGYPFL